MNASISSAPQAKKFSLSVGAIVSIVFHSILFVVLVYLVVPQQNVEVKPKHKAVVELVQPPPPPPPPPPKIVPPDPPKIVPPKPTPVAKPPPTPPVMSQAPVESPAPSIAPPPPPAPPAPVEAPPGPPSPPKVGIGVPSSYYSTLQSVIQNSMQFPPKSVQAGEEGVVKVSVLIARDGTVLEVTILEKSGFINLDKEGRDVFRRIGKFPPVPANVSPDVQQFRVELPINFKLGE